MSDMYYSPHKTPEMIYWKTVMAKSVKTKFKMADSGHFGFWLPAELAHTFARGTMLIFYLTPKEGESAVKQNFALRDHGRAPHYPTVIGDI